MATTNSISNASNPLSSTTITIDPGSSGDSSTQFNINESNIFISGVDDTDSGYKLSLGSTLGTSDTMTIDVNGIINLPLNPCFLAYGTTGATNVTGDGTAYQINVLNSEVFDQSNSFDTSTSVFTAPITGRYQLISLINFGDINASNTRDSYIVISTSNRNYLSNQSNYAAIRDTSTNQLSLHISTITDMDIGDTSNIIVSVSNSTKTTDLICNGSSDINTFFCGSLIA